MVTGSLHEAAREIPVWHDVDLCVLGGSCTGVFAAIRAARLGLKVVVVEKANCFGGVATISLVCVWHSLWDTVGDRQIISGLTEETIERLERRGQVRRNKITDPSVGFTFNPEELKIDLDEMVRENGVIPMLHTSFCAPQAEDGELKAVYVENKSGRGAVKARVFIDATGDGDLAARAGCETYFASHLQPSTTCAVISGWNSLNLGEENYQTVVSKNAEEFNLPHGFIWGGIVPGSDNYMMAGTRVYDANPANGDDLTRAEIEGRRQVRAIMDILRREAPDAKLSLAALPSRIGLRESRHVKCAYQLTGHDVLYGREFDDAIAYGSYRVDIHHQDKPGITLRYLDGSELYVRPGYPGVQSRWREATETNPTFYQIPYRSMVPGSIPNLLVAGRMIDADIEAHAAIRVMVNMNQTGEAAGTAAYLMLRDGKSASQVNPAELRRLMDEGGSRLGNPKA